MQDVSLQISITNCVPLRGYKMAEELQNQRGVKSKLSVVGLLIELIRDGSEKYDDDIFLWNLPFPDNAPLLKYVF